MLFLSALESVVDIHGQLSFQNPGNQPLPLQDAEVPEALVLATSVYVVTAMLVAWKLLRGSALHTLLFLVLSLRGLVVLLRWVDLCLVQLNGEENAVAQISWALFAKAT